LFQTLMNLWIRLEVIKIELRKKMIEDRPSFSARQSRTTKVLRSRCKLSSDVLMVFT
jgi:hypothetical protein